MSDLIAEYSELFFGKVKIFNDKIIISQFFGLQSMSIPIQKVSSVHRLFLGVIKIETIGGGGHHVYLWGDKGQEAIDNIMKTISSNQD